MKYYLIFLKIPDNKKKKIKGLQANIFGSHDYKYNKDGDYWFGLYAWTTSKKFYKKFKEERDPNLFLYQKKDYKTKFEEENILPSEYRLDEFVFVENSESSVKIVTTKCEYEISIEEYIHYESGISSMDLTDPVIFTKNFAKLLDSVGYSYYYYNQSADLLPFEDDSNANKGFYLEDLNSRYDAFVYNLGYKYKEHSYINDNGDIGLQPQVNQFNTFVELYGNLFL